MKEYISRSPKETEKIAFSLAQKIKKPTIVALVGDLGGGKTTFAQGFAKGLRVKEKVKSPSFVLYRQYQLKGKPKHFYHFDLYRLEDKDEILGLGLEEILESEAVILIEWADKIKELLPKKMVRVEFFYQDEGKRRIVVTMPSSFMV